MPAKKPKRLIDRTKEVWDTAGDIIEEAREKSTETIQEHPLTSVIVAAAIGAVAGVATAEIIRGIRKKEKKSVLKRLKRIF